MNWAGRAIIESKQRRRHVWNAKFAPYRSLRFTQMA